MQMIRLFEAIKYLHSNGLIHRDINPENILINHDYLLFLSDLEYIRPINQSNLIDKEITFDIGSLNYAPPEQIENSEYKISYTSDIYSFGQIIHYLFEHKDMFDIDNSNYNQIIDLIKTKKLIPSMEKTPIQIQYLIKNCIKYNPNDRLKENEINENINEQINSLYFFEPSFLINELKNMDKKNLDHFFKEIIIFLSNETTNKDLEDFFSLFIDDETVLSFLNRIGSYYRYGIVFQVDYLKSKIILEELVKHGNSGALNVIGLFYRDGLGVTQDYKKAKEYFQLSMDKNNSSGIMHMGNLFDYGFGVPQDYKKAIQYYQKSAELKNSGAMNFLGVHYLKGIGVKRDFKKARKFFKESAKLGNSNALNFLGNIYLTGEGVKINYLKAKKYFQQALEKSNHNAYIHIGNLYLSGYGFTKDYKKAKDYFNSAIKHGNSDAFIGLGFLYLIGLGVEKDYNKAKELFESSSQRNNIFADIYIGNLYFYGQGVKRDYKKAIEYFKKSLKKGNSKAYNNLGKVYCDNYGDVQDFNKAKYYFDLSLNNGNHEALILIGDIYLKIKNDVKKAIEYYNLAAKELIDDAYISLGKIYFYGNNIEKDYQKAKEYFEKAAERNNSDAFYFLGRIYFEGLGVKCDYEKARIYFESSVSNDNIKALFFLGSIYENGKGVRVNKEKAIEYYKKCAENHDEISIIFDSNYWNQKTQFNENYYIANNNLGLIYLLEYNDIELGSKYLKKSYFGEYSYSQCNFALICKFYFNEIKNAKYLLKRAAKQHFAIAEFIIGSLKEEKKSIQKSINHYLNTIKYENMALTTWGNNFIFDKRLEISKIYIIFLTNLKLIKFHLSQSESSKKILLHAIFRPLFKLLFESNNNSYYFKFEIRKNGDDFVITNLSNFIFNFPLFKLNKIGANDGWKLIENSEIKTIIIEFNVKTNHLKDDQKANKEEKLSTDSKIDNSFDFLNTEIENIFNYYNNFNEFISFESKIENNIRQIQFDSKTDKFKRALIYNNFFYNINIKDEEIDETIMLMKEKMLDHPFPILFGRIPINKKFDDSFYEGFSGD